MSKRRRNIISDSLLTRRHGQAIFEGKKKQVKCSMPTEDFKNSRLVEVGELEELELETPLEPKFNAYGIIKSTKKPFVVATENGSLVLVISSDVVGEEIPPEQINPADQKIKEAIELHTAFHGTEFESIKKIKLDDPEYLLFAGHLNHIVYSVPQYSERRGVPFIHEAKDRGDDVPPARDKPIVCVSPKRDFLIMSGSQFEFTERGIIG